MNLKSNSMKVLAVDDNRTNLHILQVFLKKLGHEVILAENGEQAIEKFITDAPDIILLDIMMPVMDGFEAARRIKAMTAERWTPIIFLSALNREENLLVGLEAGADDYLTKPVNFVILEAKLRSMHRSLTLQQTSIDALRRVQAISDNVIDAIITFNCEGNIVSANHSTERIFGYSADELLGHNISTLIPENHQLVSSSSPALQTNSAEHEVLALHKNGCKFPANIGITEISIDNEQMHICVVRDISNQKLAEQTLRDNATQLQRHYDHTQNEQQLALRLMEMQLHRPGLNDPRVQYKVIAAENFSGDIVAANRAPSGRLYALLADATGHGLTAAISVLPVLAIFYRLTRRDHELSEIIAELNQQLKESVPIGRFVAATLISIDETNRTGEIWVGGTPSAFMFDRWGRMTREFISENLPLGIVDNNSLSTKPVEFTWSPESQLVICSDGLLEATDVMDKQFGMDGLIEATANSSPTQRFGRIEEALNLHLKDISAADDVSLMIVDCL